MQLSKTAPNVAPVSADEVRQRQKTGKDELNQQDFLNLLIVQMKNQDPLNPMDNTEFMQQTTSFSQLEQLINMNNGIQALLESKESDSSLDMTLVNGANFIGKKIEYSTNTLSITPDGISPISFYSSDKAPNARISIYNSQGALVGSMEAAVDKGTNAIAWDGTINGATLPEGSYYFEVSGTSPEGTEIITSTFGEGVVIGVSMSSGKLYFELENGLVPAESVYSVKDVNIIKEKDS